MAITHADLRTATFRRWSARAYLDGALYPLTDLPSRTIGFLRNRGTCRVPTQALVKLTSGQPAFVDIVLNETKSQRFFTGRIDPLSAASATLNREVNLIDLLGVLDRAVGTDLNWEDTPFDDAVRELLTAAGLTAADIDSIYNPGSDYDLGTVYGITIKGTETISAVMRDLMAYGGTAIYVTAAGRVRVIDAPGIPSASSEIVYANGANLVAGEFGIFDARIEIEGNESVISSFTATGPKRPDGAIPDGTFTASSISGKAESLESRFLQTDALAQTIAERELNRRARARVNVVVEAPLNPLLQPGDNILFRDAAIGYPNNTGAIIMEISTSGPAMSMQLSIGSSLLDGDASSVQPPVADFAMDIESEPILLAGVPAARYMVQCRDQSRDRNGGTITARAWTATGGSVTPASSSDEKPLFVFTTLEDTEISLQVTSSTGEEATVTKSPEATDTIVFNRVLSVATADGWKVLDGTTWRTFAHSAACTAVPSFNERGPLIAGFADGAIYTTATRLATPPTLLASLGGSIDAIFVNETDVNHILVSHNEGTLSRSLNGGASWTVVASVDDTIYYVESSPQNPNEVRICLYNQELISYTGGQPFTALIDGPLGSTPHTIASAPWGHAVVFSGGSTATATCLQFEEGYTVDWSGIAAPDQPSGLKSITPLLSSEGFLAGSGDIADLLRDGQLDALVFGAATGTSGRLYLLLWDGSQFVATLLTPTLSAGSAFKITNPVLGAAAWSIDTPTATQIGYGDLALPSKLPTIYRLPEYDSAGAANKLWRWQAGTWTGIDLPSADRQAFFAISASPLDPLQLLLAQYTTGASTTMRLHYSADGGASWSTVWTKSIDAGPGHALTWLSDGSWAVFSGNVLSGTSLLSRGSAAAESNTLSIPYALASGTAAGQVGDLLLNRYPGGVGYLPAGAGAVVNALASYDGTTGTFAVRNGGRRAVWSSFFGGEIWRSQDYRAGGWASVAGTSGASAAVLTSETAIIAGRSNGIQEAITVFEVPVVTLAHASGTASGGVRADAQTQTVAAATLSSNRTALRTADGAWSTIDPPSGVAFPAFGLEVAVE